MEFMYFISSFYFKSVKVKGKNNINKLKGQYIIIINHSSHLDFPTLAKHLPLRLKTRLATGAAADYFFRSKNFKQIFVSKFFTYLLGSFPLSRIKDGKSSSSIKQSFEFVGEIVDRGWSIGLSPEGTRSKTGKLNSFKNGIGTILKETKLPVIPIKLNGLHDILPPHSKYPLKRGHVEIIFGKPIKYPGNMSTTEITKSLEKTIRGM